MSKMIGGLAFMFVILTILAAALNGGGGLNTTYLTANISSGASTIPVASTSGYLNADYLVIGGEKITYTGISGNNFTGINVTQTHLSGTMVYSPSTSLLNNALGFNVGAVSSSVGLFSVITIPVKFFTTTLPNLVEGNLMPGLDGALAIFAYLWLAIVIGIVISIAIALIWVASGIIK